MLKQVRRIKPPPPVCDSLLLLAPLTLRELRTERRAQRAATEIDYDYIDRLWSTAERHALQNDILYHENQNLRLAIAEETKRRKQGKPLGLINPDNPG